VSSRPRAAAAEHLPELADSFDALATTFAAKLVYLQTPDGSWGKEPDWTTWPSVRLDELHPLAEPTEPRARDRRR
jgi:hypothetical protein